MEGGSGKNPHGGGVIFLTSLARILSKRSNVLGCSGFPGLGNMLTWPKLDQDVRFGSRVVELVPPRTKPVRANLITARGLLPDHGFLPGEEPFRREGPVNTTKEG